MVIVNHKIEAPGMLYRNSPSQSGPRTSCPLLVMHYTAGASFNGDLTSLSSAKAPGSAHLLVGGDGTTAQCVPFDRIAWHCGKSSYEFKSGRFLMDLNRWSIGIELCNPGPLTKQGDRYKSWFGGLYPFTPEELDKLEKSHRHVDAILGRQQPVLRRHEKAPGQDLYWIPYPLPQLWKAAELARIICREYGVVEVVGHEIINTQKLDPGPAFPMEVFRPYALGRVENNPFETAV